MFNVRVYGILIENNRLLLTDEYRLGMLMTKFPGGGLEYGEGTLDCLKREWIEETGLRINTAEHYYTTDFFQPSYKLPESNQVINIYYLVTAEGTSSLAVTTIPFDFPELKDGMQRFRWLELGELNEKLFTLPIDKVVARKLLDDLSGC